MPERLNTPLHIAQATADLLLANTGEDESARQDLLEPSSMHALGSALASHGDARSLRRLELSAHRATHGAAALRALLPADGDGVELACIAQVATMFRMVASAARAYRDSAAGTADVPATRLLALAAVPVADAVTRESVDRVRYSLLVTQQLLESLGGPTDPTTDDLDLRSLA